MEKFDERKKSFEKKFAHDEELKFKVASRSNKYLGQWVSQKLGYDNEKEKEVLIVGKTMNKKVQKIILSVKKLHSYEIPCVIFFDIKNGNTDFLKWIIKSV